MLMRRRRRLLLLLLLRLLLRLLMVVAVSTPRSAVTHEKRVVRVANGDALLERAGAPLAARR